MESLGHNFSRNPIMRNAQLSLYSNPPFPLQSKQKKNQAMTERGYLTTVAIPLLFLQLFSLIPWRQAYTFGKDDIECLQIFKKSLIDTSGLLTSWNFNNNTAGFICNFLGIQCWHLDENRVLSIKLPGMGLRGMFPQGLNHCGSLTDIDLSDNNLSGTIPANICKQAPYLVTLDLSQNEFTGTIPEGLYNCTYLNIIRLNDNQLSGGIPWQLTRLSRLKELNVADNMLKGPIPKFQNLTDPNMFQNNPGLCGPPLNVECPIEQPIGRPINPRVVAAFALIGVVAVFWLGFALRLWITRSTSAGDLPTASSKETQLVSWASRVKAHRKAKVCLFVKPVREMRLENLLAASDNFSEENIIWGGRTGTFYKAILRDGSALAVKRLPACSRTEKEFKSEMNTVARLRHRNLLPLLGYCVADQEKLLVYKFMVNGTLFQCLHSVQSERALDWRTRLKISTGIARGLAWLHHGCSPRIIHRNICSGIVFLDEEFEPRLSGFGLARLMNVAEKRLSISGEDDNWEEEFGYDAPEEWRDPCVATLKGDVYSFGVLLLELITGVRPVHLIAVEGGNGTKELSLVEWIRNLLSEGERIEEAIHKYVDGRRPLSNNDEIELVVDLVRLGAECVNSNPEERPSMYSVYESLKNVRGWDGTSDSDDEVPLLPSR